MTVTIAANLVKQTSVTTGTGNLTLSTVAGYQSFNTAFGNGATTNIFYYFIIDTANNAWEYGTGHMSDATTLVRDTVIGSTNANAAVSFLGGTLTIINDIAAERQLVGGYRALGGTDTVVATDNGKTLTVSGTCALAVAAATTLGIFSCFIKNTATTGIQIITITPNGTDNLDGSNTTLVMLPGEMRELMGNGTALTTVVLTPFTLYMTSTATPVLPRNGYVGVSGQLWGGGGSGGAGATDGGGGGGGGGANSFTLMNGTISVASLSLTCTIGAGGLSQTSANTAGNAGGLTTVVTGGSLYLASAYGGGAGGGGSLGAGGGGGSFGGFSGGAFGAGFQPFSSGVGGSAVTTTAGIGGIGYGTGAAAGGAGQDGKGAGGGTAGGAGGWAYGGSGGGSGISGGSSGGGGGGCSAATTGGAGGAAGGGGGGGGGASNVTGGAGGLALTGGAGGAGGSNGAGTNGAVGGGGGGGAVGTAGSGAGGGGRIILKGIC